MVTGHDGRGRRSEESGPTIARRLRRLALIQTIVPSLAVGALGVGTVLLLDRELTTGGAIEGDTLRTAAVASVVAMVAVTFLAVMIGTWRASRLAAEMVEPLAALGTETERMATQGLPQLANLLHSTDGSGEIPRVDLIKVGDETTPTEITQLLDAVNSLRVASVEVAAQQAMGRSRDLAGVLVNLGRRNQALIGRQLQLIDSLESTESDPDMLRHLFTLDQLATRMRRNAESLLVLAGERVDRQSQVPLPIDVVLRAATSEVELYHKVVQDGVEPALVSPRAVSDLTHLLAELIENATAFSDPGTPVRLMGCWDPTATYTISVVDSGRGMSRRELALANARISESAVGEESPTSRLGLFVVGRLAARHGIDTRLVEAAPSGTVAKITLPLTTAIEAAPALEPGPTATDDATPGHPARYGPPPVHTSSAPITGPIPRVRLDRPPTSQGPMTAARARIAPSHRTEPDPLGGTLDDDALIDENMPTPSAAPPSGPDTTPVGAAAADVMPAGPAPDHHALQQQPLDHGTGATTAPADAPVVGEAVVDESVHPDDEPMPTVVPRSPVAAVPDLGEPDLRPTTNDTHQLQTIRHPSSPDFAKAALGPDLGLVDEDPALEVEYQGPEAVPASGATPAPHDLDSAEERADVVRSKLSGFTQGRHQALHDQNGNGAGHGTGQDPVSDDERSTDDGDLELPLAVGVKTADDE